MTTPGSTHKTSDVPQHVQAVRVEVNPLDAPPSAPPGSGEAGGLELSERRLGEIVAAIHAGEPDPLGRRLSPRVRVQGMAKLIPLGGDPAADARLVGVYDVSRNGIAFVHAEPITAGRQFNLHIDRAPRRPLEMLCTARHCRPLDGNFLIGAEYGVSALAALSSFIASPC